MMSCPLFDGDVFRRSEQFQHVMLFGGALTPAGCYPGELLHTACNEPRDSAVAVISFGVCAAPPRFSLLRVN